MSTDRSTGRRTDIQGLRAIAVSVVVIYHLKPTALPGGFVGVDVFFVISGFLITSHLLVAPPGSPRDLATFWSRRIKRLLPVALLVLTATLVASRLIAPETQWANTARQARAAGLYVVNWQLARDSVDYLAAQAAPSPVQHFWSLSVEEQFYLFWPVLILLLVWLARRTRLSQPVLVGCGLLVVVAASLAYSVHETAVSPASAFFVTPTRIWELGIGALLAAWLAPGAFGREPARVRLRPLPALVLGWLGFAAIGWSCAAYDGSTPFPGWHALVPVLGATAVIAAKPEHGWLNGGTVLSWRPVQWVGDASYSIYLWHWPLVVLLPALNGGALDDTDRLAAVALTLTLAAASKHFVEDRFRTAKWGIPLRKPYALAAVGMAIVVGLTAVQLTEVAQLTKVARVQLKQALATPQPCFGAQALDKGVNCRAVPFSQVVPALADAAEDKADAYADVSGGKDCWSYYTDDFPEVTCTFGDTSSKVDIALVGNSHAGEWLPALETLARANHWRVTTYLASRCVLADTQQSFDTAKHSADCSRWASRTTAAVAASHPALVLMANRISTGAVGLSLARSTPAYEAGLTTVLRSWQKAGLDVLALRDTPYPGSSIPDCLADHQSHPSSCDGTRASWLPPDPTGTAMETIGDPHFAFVDLTDHICGPIVCSAINGGVITYFDGSHLTATYAQTLAPYLAPHVKSMLAGKPRTIGG